MMDELLTIAEKDLRDAWIRLDLVGSPRTAHELWKQLRNVVYDREAPLLPYRSIGYTAEECERDMRRMTNGERGCANPNEHEGSSSPHMEPSP